MCKPSDSPDHHKGRMRCRAHSGCVTSTMVPAPPPLMGTPGNNAAPCTNQRNIDANIDIDIEKCLPLQDFSCIKHMENISNVYKPAKNVAYR